MLGSQHTAFASFVVASLCSDLQTFVFLSVSAVTMPSNVNPSLFNPPSLSDDVPEVAAGDQAPVAAPEEDVAEDDGGETTAGVYEADPDAAEAAATPEDGADPENEDNELSDTTPDPLPMRDLSEVVEDPLNPATVEEPTYSNENMDSTTWTNHDVAEKSRLVKTFISVEGLRCHVDTLKWDEKLTRGQSRVLQQEIIKKIRKSVENFWLFAMVQVMLQDNESMCLGRSARAGRGDIRPENYLWVLFM